MFEEGTLLQQINSPSDVKLLPQEQLGKLADEIRAELLKTVSANGGHLASNLGVVELTIALHRVFSCPADSILFDVGHQSYTHKLLTGRREQFSTLRQFGGLSGFPRREESPCDAFGCGHSSTSVSAAIGIATANRLAGKEVYTVAVIGDGAFTGGMAYEALNNCAGNDRLIIILNDNTMSIARNVGAMDTYLNRFRNSAKYFRMKNRIKYGFQCIPFCGKGLVRVCRRIKRQVRHLLVRENLFEHMGLSYYGPLDGNDEALLETVLQEAKRDGKCSVVHICTKKGKGYSFAEERPDLFHGVGKFDPTTGQAIAKSDAKSDARSFSAAFGDILCELAKQDERICAITAAMPDGTGLNGFAAQFPERFFDVGIAEEHAATFAAGLASQGMKPVFVVYSTFAQRAYDQLLHDCALQSLPMVLALDRAGLVGEDGATHHGIFDVAFLGNIPAFSLYAPLRFSELQDCLQKAFDADAPVAIRYPKGAEPSLPWENFVSCGDLQYVDYGEHPTVALFTYGRMTEQALQAAELLQARGIQTRVIRLYKLLPLNAEAAGCAAGDARTVYFLEEGIRAGGIGERLVAAFAQAGAAEGRHFGIRAIDNCFPPHGSNAKLFELLHFTPAQVADELEGMERHFAN